MWLSVIQTQQRERVGVCLCLCMPVSSCVAQCALLHAQVCVRLYMRATVCVMCVMQPHCVCVQHRVDSWHSRDLQFFCIPISVERVKLNNSWYNCQQIPVTTGYRVTMDTVLCIANFSSLHGTEQTSQHGHVLTNVNTDLKSMPIYFILYMR